MGLAVSFFLMFLFMIIVNYGIHLYYKNKRKTFFEIIGKQNFIEIKNVETGITAKSKVSWSYKYFVSDVVIYENSIFLLLRNYVLYGLINQNQPIIQVSGVANPIQIDGVGRMYQLQKMECKEYEIRMFSEQNRIINATFIITLDLENKHEYIELIKSTLNRFNDF